MILTEIERDRDVGLEPGVEVLDANVAPEVGA